MDHQAFAQLLGNYGEFVGSIAVVATLGYLAVQTRQNTRALRTASFHAVRQSFSELSLAMAQDPSLTQIVSQVNRDEDLDNVQRERANMLFTTILRRGESAFFQSHQGSLEYESWIGIRDSIAPMLHTKLGREYWQSQSSRFTSQYVDALADVLSN